MKKIVVLPLMIALILCFGAGVVGLSIPGVQNPSIVKADVGFEHTQDVAVSEITIEGNIYDIYYHCKVGNYYVNAAAAECAISVEGSTIVAINQRGLVGYRFSHFEIMMSDGLSHLFQTNTELNSDYLYTYDKIRIIGVYIRVCEVSVIVSEDNQKMGDYSIYIETKITVDGKEELVHERVMPENGKFLFDSGTTIIIEANPLDFHRFGDFGQNSTTERISNDPTSEDFNKLRIVVLINRTFTLSFVKDFVSLNKDKVQKGVEISADQVKLGDEVYIYASNVKKTHEIKDFKINGIAVNHKDYVGDVDYSHGSAVITITEDWLAGYGGILEVEVTTKLKEVYVIIGLISAVVIPLMIIFLLLLFVQGNKTKKITRDILKTEQGRKYKMDTGRYIEGIRSGEISGQVTDKDIKADLKKTKKEIAKDGSKT